MGTFRMPSLGADMATGRLTEWLVEPGSPVRRGDVVAVIETQKGAIEIEVFEDGILTETLVAPGTEVPVGTPIATIGSPDDAETEVEADAKHPAAEPAVAAAASAPAPAAAPPSASAPKPAELPAPAPGATEARPPVRTPAAMATATAPPAESRPKVSPAARRLAAEHGLDPGDLPGTGPDGAVVVADIERAAGGREPGDQAAVGAPASSAAPAPAPATAETPRPGLHRAEMRRAIAAAMARSKREIPHFYLEHTVALTGLRARLDALNADRPPAERLLPAVFVIRATARALARHPGFNGHYVDGEFRPAERVHLGTAVAIRGGGLIAPAIHDADRLDLDQLMARLKDLVARARGGGLRGSELADPTATLSSLGERGVDALYGVIHPPQVALIGAGRPVRRPWAEGDAVAVREVMTLTLAADHRVGDGHAGALFLAEIGRLIETPEEP